MKPLSSTSATSLNVDQDCIRAEVTTSMMINVTARVVICVMACSVVCPVICAMICAQAHAQTLQPFELTDSEDYPPPPIPDSLRQKIKDRLNSEQGLDGEREAHQAAQSAPRDQVLSGDPERAPATKPLTEWPPLTIPEPRSLKDEPWVICLMLTGSSLTHIAQVYTVQPRYGAWTAQWRWIRPRGYPSEEDVGLLTSDKLQTSINQVVKMTQDAQLTPILSAQAPPCLTDEVSASSSTPKLRAPLLRAQLWVIAPSAPSTQRAHEQSDAQQPERPVEPSRGAQSWYYWRFENPHISEDTTSWRLISAVRDAIYQSAPKRDVLDALLKPKERAKLKLIVSHPAHVWIDEVYQGRWPSTQQIYLPGGHYKVRAVPLNPRLEPLSYDEVEVLRGRLTTFRVSFE